MKKNTLKCTNMAAVSLGERWNFLGKTVKRFSETVSSLFACRRVVNTHLAGNPVSVKLGSLAITNAPLIRC